MTNHFSFSTDLIFLFSFLFLFNIFLNSFVVLKNNLLAASSEKKISPGHSDRNKQFFFFWPYVRFLHMKVLHKVLNMPECGWICPMAGF